MKVTINPSTERTVTIEMTESEAVTLRIVCQFIGGDMHQSRRRHIDDIDEELREAGLDLPHDGKLSDTPTGGIHFPDEEDTDAD